MTRADVVADATNTLVLAPAWRPAFAACAGAVDADARLLLVTYERPAVDYLAALEEVGAEPAECVVVDATDEPGEPADGVEVRSESSQRLTRVGLHTNEVLTRWGGDDAPIVVYFDSISALLSRAALDVVYRLLHPFTGQVHGADARAFYRLDPDAHDVATHQTLEQLFDAFLTVHAKAGSVRHHRTVPV